MTDTESRNANEEPDGGVEHDSCRPAGPSHWQRKSTFWAAAFVLLVILLGLVPVIDNGSIAVPDDGVYSAQVDLLSHGSWDEVRPAADIDSDGVNSAIGPGVISRDRQVPYARHPLFTLTLVPFFRIGGLAGMMVFSVIGVWLASLAAGLLTRRLEPRLGVVALLLTGLGSPLLFDAYLVSAHGMAAGLCGMVLLGVAHAVDGRRWWPLMYTLPCAAVLVGIRTEGTIAMIATAVLLCILAVHPRRATKVDWHSVSVAASIGTVTTIAYLLDAAASRSIVAAAGTSGAPLLRRLTPHRDPLAAAWASLVRPWAGNGATAQPAVALAAVAIIIGAIALKVAPRRWLLPVSLSVLAAVCLVYQNTADIILITGFLAVAPIVIAGIVLLRRSNLEVPMVQRNLGVSFLTVVAVTVTTYEVGGAVEWGGRFYHLLIPLLVPLTVVGLDNGYRSMPRRPALIALGSLTVASLALSGLVIQHQKATRRVTQQVTSAAAAFALEHQSGSGATTTPLAIVGLLTSDGTARMFWKSDRVDVLTAVGVNDIFRLAMLAEQHGYRNATLITNIPLPSVELVGKPWLDDIGWEIGDVKPIGDTPFGLIELRRSDSSK